MYKRQILATETPYLILDEPTAGQDAEGIAILSHLIDALQAEGRSVITITHDIEFVADNFDRVVAMAQKHIIADGSARDIFWNEEVVSTSRIRKTAIGELAKELKIGERILYCDEMVE